MICLQEARATHVNPRNLIEKCYWPAASDLVFVCLLNYTWCVVQGFRFFRQNNKNAHTKRVHFMPL
jgi:hypothetical protein